MLSLDHLAVVAPSMPEGVAHVRDCLGLTMPEGGRHPQMGTRNHLLRLGDAVFLEVIAVDPDAVPPERPRWFGLDDADRVRSDWEAGRRLRSFVARTNDLDHVLSRHGGLFGEAIDVTRGDLAWRFAVRPNGSLPEDGLVPCVMDWGAYGNPAHAMPDLGAYLDAFEVEHPDPARVADLYALIDLADPPAIRASTTLRFTARVRTPEGVRALW